MSNNTSIEQLAINAAIQFELDRLGLTDASQIRVVKSDGYDLLSADGRTIEVKGTASHRLNTGLVLNSRLELEHLERGGYLYRVINCHTQPIVYVFQLEDLSIEPEYRARVKINSAHP